MAFFPSEILELVFAQLKRDGDKLSTQAALNAILVCHQWHLAGRRVIWRDMVLKSTKARPGLWPIVTRPEPLQSLVDCPGGPCRWGLSGFDLVRSLTVVWPAIDHDFKPPNGNDNSQSQRDKYQELLGDTGTRQDISKSLPAVVRPMQQLTTFSFVMRDMESTMVRKTPWLSADDLVDTITALPQSVQNLEIDVGLASPTTQASQPSYLCEAIAKRMSQLKHARLRLPCFCPNILAASAKLETLVFPLVDEPITMPSCPYCSQPERPESDGFERTGKQARQEFVTALKTYLPRWPKLQKLLVVSRAHGRHLELSLATRDLLRDETALNYCFRYFEDHVAYMDRKILFMRYIDNDGMIRDLLGRIEECGELLEGPMWATTVNGSRFPTAYRKSDVGYSHIWREHEGFDSVVRSHRQAPSAEWKQAWSEDHNTATKLWVDEAEAGHFLVQPQTIQGC